MAIQHKELAAGGWQRLSLAEQLANVGSEVGRMRRWHGHNPEVCERAFLRALELLDLTLSDTRWSGRRKELSRIRAFLCDAMLGGREHGSTLEDLDRYFLAFAVAARAGR
ncbi:MAG: hypothetical protein A3H49_11805 [Nitrospirae bacterium RIFCSPLOWO2_02_FULL_62_14]|nr:MAG: hypothetical protein A3H49_11805 [Nitrospirae bacterium RIFCSPLOWO2_02_FULL_62_14]OGW68486.1 MAG: hypothetical protein A3A88_06530 [Nitrospirae bacterium RIFCSPLOWO2_01_FULL_62_17]